MKRHPFNIFSLITGVVLVMLAAWAVWIAVPLQGSYVIDFSRWLVPAAAIVVGAALLSPLFKPKNDKKTPEDEVQEDEPEVSVDAP